MTTSKISTLQWPLPFLIYINFSDYDSLFGAKGDDSDDYDGDLRQQYDFATKKRSFFRKQVADALAGIRTGRQLREWALRGAMGAARSVIADCVIRVGQLPQNGAIVDSVRNVFVLSVFLLVGLFSRHNRL